jgi:hypothetical protein
VIRVRPSVIHVRFSVAACPPFACARPPFALRSQIFMATLCSDLQKLPSEGSSYFEYLCSIPVGASVHVELSCEPPGALSETEVMELFFTVKKVGDNGWSGLKCSDDVSTTAELYSHVRAVLAEDEEEVIRVCHGRDPMKVKREMVEEAVKADQEIKFYTFNEVIELDSETEDDTGSEVSPGKSGAGKSAPAALQHYKPRFELRYEHA